MTLHFLCINDPPWLQTGKDMSVNDPRSSWVVARWLPGHDRRLTFNGMGVSTRMPMLGTPPKFNMEPEKKSLEKEVPLGNHHFQIPC